MNASLPPGFAMLRRCVRAAPAVLVWCLPAAAVASGSYRTQPPRPGQVDTRLYHLGKDIFLGKVVPGAMQEAELKELEAKLPANAKEKSTLAPLAGKLSSNQLEALSYYLAVRYRLPGVAQEVYDQGAAVFESRFEKEAVAGLTARTQERRLKELQGKLPTAARDKVNLPRLAGKISDDQLAALEFYLAVKYRLRTIDPE